MSASSKRLFATDKEIHDLLASARQKMTTNQLSGLARDRRIFFAPDADRDQLVDYLSLLPHDLYDVEGLLDRLEPSTRGEKTTFVRINGSITSAHIDTVLRDYRTNFGSDEEVTIQPPRPESVAAMVGYSEFDFSRTTLLQRQDRKARLEFRIEEDGVTVRMPATDKGQEIVRNLIDSLEKNMKSPLVREEISVEGFDAISRTTFFLDLIRGIEGYELENVTNVRVCAADGDADDLDDGSADEKSVAAPAEFLGVVRNVALSGDNLLRTPQYQQLLKSDFFVTAFTWRSIQTAAPYDKVQFEAAFDLPEQGTGFKYMVRYAPQSTTTKEYPTYFKAVPDNRKPELFRIIEKAARKSLGNLRKPSPAEEKES